MQLVYVKYLNEVYPANGIGFYNKYWAITFDGMCAIIGLDMGCPILYEILDEVKSGLLVGLSKKIPENLIDTIVEGYKTIDLTELHKTKFKKYLNDGEGDSNKNKVISIKKVNDYYAATIYPSSSLLSLEKEKAAYFFKQRSENISLIKKDLKKDLKDSIENQIILDKILTNLGDNDTTSYKNRYNNMYLKEIELNNYYEKLYKIKSLLNEIVIHRKNYLKNKLELCDRAGYMPAIYSSLGEIQGEREREMERKRLELIVNKFSNNLKEKYNIFKDDALFKDIRSLTKKIYNKIQEMEYNLTPYEVMLNNSENWNDRKCGNKSKEIRNSIKEEERKKLKYVNKFEEISNKEENLQEDDYKGVQETPTRLNNAQGPTSPVSPYNPSAVGVSPVITRHGIGRSRARTSSRPIGHSPGSQLVFEDVNQSSESSSASASSPPSASTASEEGEGLNKRKAESIADRVATRRRKTEKEGEKEGDKKGGRKKTLKLKRNKHKTRRHRVVNKRTRKYFRIKHKTRRNK